MIRQRVRAGITRAKAHGTKTGRPFGRPKINGAVAKQAQQQLAKGIGIIKVAKALGLGTGTVQRIKAELAAE